MPCKWSRRCGAPAADQTPIETNDEGVAMESWHSIRRENLRNLRKQTRHIVLAMAFMEAMRVGPAQIVYAGTHGFAAKGPGDFGIAYNVGYFFSWIYVCLFMIVYVPLFSWWVPVSSSEESKSSFTAQLVEFLKSINMILLPFTVGICLGQHIWHTIRTIIYVDSRPAGTNAMPVNNRKNWLIRLVLISSVLMSLTLGKGVFGILAEMDLAHVKTYEYAVIVVPIQINLGLLFGSGMQWKIENKIKARKLAAQADNAEEEARIVVVDEKRALM